MANTHRCQYIDCTNRGETKRIFRFPVKNRPRCEQWITACGNTNLASLSEKELYNRYICIDHFSCDAFVNPDTMNRLRPTAVPHHHKALIEVRFVDNWPVTDASDIVFILICYLIFVIKLGPHVLKARRPYKMKWWLVFYNAARVVDSALLTDRFVSSIMDKGVFPVTCEHEEWTRYEIAFLYWRLMVSKILDLSDTVHFVLLKKYSHITCLHVFQRVVVLPLAWFCVKYDPSDQWAFMGAVNCSISTVVYFYFGMAALGPRFVRALWLKKYLTMMQVVQLFLITGHLTVQILLSECAVHPFINWICIACALLFICVGVDCYLNLQVLKSVEAKLLLILGVLVLGKAINNTKIYFIFLFLEFVIQR